MHSKHSRALGLLLFLLFALSLAVAQAPQFVPFSAAQPVLNTYLKTPAGGVETGRQAYRCGLGQLDPHQDKEIRIRIEAGEENTLTNLLRLGVTYTQQPRSAYEIWRDTDMTARRTRLPTAGQRPHQGPGWSTSRAGMMEMRALLEKKGYSLKTPADQAKVKAYLLANLARLRDDVAHDAAEAKINKFQAFKDRGISTDSNLYPDYGIDLHLQHMMHEGLLKPGSIHRIAIVGPGLDFVNKKSGTDFYPPQTTQPFAVIDTLVRLGLADPNTIQVETFDISSRVNKHLDKARREAAAGKPYVIQLLSSPSDGWDKTYFQGSWSTGRSWEGRSENRSPPFPCPKKSRAKSGTARLRCVLTWSKKLLRWT